MSNVSKLNELLSYTHALEVGIEREGLRVQPDGRVAATPHPTVYGDKIDNPNITVDFCEQQIEVITTPANSSQSAYDQLRALNRIVQMKCREDSELLWPSSVPSERIEEDDIQIATYRDDDEGNCARAYREKLAEKYGKKKQLLSGVHYNFSLNDAIVEHLEINRDDLYLGVVRNFLELRWLLILLMGAAPSQDPNSVSQRMGASGYHNNKLMCPDYTSVNAYCECVEDYIASGRLSEPKELYSAIRIKAKNPADVLGSLKTDGIAYLEVRMLDVNPFDEAGLAKIDLDFLELFMLFLSFLRLPKEGNPTQRQAWDVRAMSVADGGLETNLNVTLHKSNIPLSVAATEILSDMEAFLALLPDALNFEGYRASLAEMQSRISNPSKLYSMRIHALTDSTGFDEAMLALAAQYQQAAYDQRWILTGYENWELSTQIVAKEALRRGLKLEPIDSIDNIICVTRDWHDLPYKRDYIVQATRTSADTYVTPLLMNNKTVTKHILRQHGIPTPDGDELSRDSSQLLSDPWLGVPCVVKPKSTNFGVGITMLTDGPTRSQLDEAMDEALKFDERFLIESYVPGHEYRFLVIDGKVLAVLNRIPANVVGDGSSTINELIATKNKHPFRADGYRMPLNTIKIDSFALEFLSRSNLDPDSVPARGQHIQLRPNSNISTGGDSVDVTDQANPAFFKVAIKAAAAFDAVFCGVDLIVGDLTDASSSYSIIEVNWNPAIHAHEFPAVGPGRPIAASVLRAIDMIP